MPFIVLVLEILDSEPVVTFAFAEELSP